MNSVELSMLREASAGRVAAQFIVRSKGIGGAATNKQFSGFCGSKKSGNGYRGYHDALLATMSLTLKRHGKSMLHSGSQKLVHKAMASATVDREMMRYACSYRIQLPTIFYGRDMIDWTFVVA
ncbi:MAG: hypothetical protein ABF449_12925 [Ethanoligenens sp.]